MISAKLKTRFKYIDRGKENFLVLVPGWASDYKIFDSLDLEYNYIVPVEFSPFDFEEILLETLKTNNIKKASIFGLSLGGFLAAKFASKYPDLIDELTLVGIRKKYKAEEIREVKNNLKKQRYESSPCIILKKICSDFFEQIFPLTDEMEYKDIMKKHISIMVEKKITSHNQWRKYYDKNKLKEEGYIRSPVRVFNKKIKDFNKTILQFFEEIFPAKTEKEYLSIIKKNNITNRRKWYMTSCNRHRMRYARRRMRASWCPSKVSEHYWNHSRLR